MRVRYIKSLSGAVQTYPAFEKDEKGEWVFYEVDELEAVRLIDAEYALAEKETEYKKAKANVEVLLKDAENKRIIAENAEKLESLKVQRDTLTAQLAEINSTISIIENAMNSTESKGK